MKVLIILSLVHLFAFVHSRNVENLIKFGAKDKKDVRLFAQDFNVGGNIGSTMLNVNFPPTVRESIKFGSSLIIKVWFVLQCLGRLKEFYTISALIVKDYNPYTATISIERGGIGQNEFDIEIISPPFRQVDVNVEYWGTFNVEKFLATPMKVCGYK